MENKELAITILRQLGGNKFIAMTGARNFGILSGNNGIGFSIPRTNKVKYIRIRLNSLDTYDLEFLNTKFEIISEKLNIYCDQLQEVFTAQTGLYTSL